MGGNFKSQVSPAIDGESQSLENWKVVGRDCKMSGKD